MSVEITTVMFHPRRYAVYVDGELYDSCESHGSDEIVRDAAKEFDIDEENHLEAEYDYWEGAPKTVNDIEKEYQLV